MKRIIGVIVLAAVLSGCQTTGQKISSLVPGSRPDRVVATLGKPDAERSEGRFEIYTYRNRRTLRSLHGIDYTAIFERGRLVAFGPGFAELIGPGHLVVVPPRLGIP